MLTGLGFRYQLQITGVIDLTVNTVRAIPGRGKRSGALHTRRSLVHDFRAFHQSLADCPTVRRRRVKEIEQDLPLLLDHSIRLLKQELRLMLLEQVLEANSPRRHSRKSSESFKSMFWRSIKRLLENANATSGHSCFPPLFPPSSKQK